MARETRTKRREGRLGCPGQESSRLRLKVNPTGKVGKKEGPQKQHRFERGKDLSTETDVGKESSTNNSGTGCTITTLFPQTPFTPADVKRQSTATEPTTNLRTHPIGQRVGGAGRLRGKSFVCRGFGRHGFSESPFDGSGRLCPRTRSALSTLVASTFSKCLLSTARPRPVRSPADKESVGVGQSTRFR